MNPCDNLDSSSVFPREAAPRRKHAHFERRGGDVGPASGCGQRIHRLGAAEVCDIKTRAEISRCIQRTADTQIRKRLQRFRASIPTRLPRRQQAFRDCRNNSLEVGDSRRKGGVSKSGGLRETRIETITMQTQAAGGE